jgi:hypothetical protein
MSGDVHVRFWESAGVRFPRATHLPLHRQESILARHGWDVRRSTLCDHLRTCGQLLTPLYDLMHRRLLRSFAIHTDDTPLVLLRPRRTAYAWVYLGDAANPYTLFDLTAGRRQEFPRAFLAGYRGFIHADAYDGYNGVHADIRHLGCWMHARRYFVEAEPTDPRAVEALAFVRTLYAVEREIAVEHDRPGVTLADAEVVGRARARRGAGPVTDRARCVLVRDHTSQSGPGCSRGGCGTGRTGPRESTPRTACRGRSFFGETPAHAGVWPRWRDGSRAGSGLSGSRDRNRVRSRPPGSTARHGLPRPDARTRPVPSHGPDDRPLDGRVDRLAREGWSVPPITVLE